MLFIHIALLRTQKNVDLQVARAGKTTHANRRHSHVDNCIYFYGRKCEIMCAMHKLEMGNGHMKLKWLHGENDESERVSGHFMDLNGAALSRSYAQADVIRTLFPIRRWLCAWIMWHTAIALFQTWPTAFGPWQWYQMHSGARGIVNHHADEPKAVTTRLQAKTWLIMNQKIILEYWLDLNAMEKEASKNTHKL